LLATIFGKKEKREKKFRRLYCLEGLGF
jgi:hypothetical protein